MAAAAAPRMSFFMRDLLVLKETMPDGV